MRRSGEPYIAHPLGVAMIIAELGLDDVTIAGALLHDAVEDTTVTIDDLEQQFGDEIARDRRRCHEARPPPVRLSSEAQQAATLRKMLVAMASDIRVLLIKLADRLHNMRTIASLPEEKQQRIAQETLDVYAPLAHRLGIADVKWQLEDLAFAVLHPKRYAEIEQMVASRAPERDGLPRRPCSRRSRTVSPTCTSRRQVVGPSEALLVDLREDDRARARSSTTCRTSSASASSSTR